MFNSLYIDYNINFIMNMVDNSYLSLIDAVFTKNLNIVKRAIELTYDIDEEDINGTTALMHASIYGYNKIIHFLLLAGANINKENKYGNTALIFACKNGHVAAVKLLLHNAVKGANIYHTNIKGFTAYSITQDPEILKLFEITTKCDNVVIMMV
jgi:ankyrin repeat protein